MPVSPHSIRPARRLVVGLATVAVSSFAVSGLAFGDASDLGFTQGDSRGVVSSDVVAPGVDITFSAIGFEPGEPIAIALSSAGDTKGYARVTATAAGTASTKVAIDQSGIVTISATGQLSGHMATSTVSAETPGRGASLVAARPTSTVPYNVAGLSWLSVAALALAGAFRLVILHVRSATAARPAPAFALYVPPVVKGGKHRKRS